MHVNSKYLGRVVLAAACLLSVISVFAGEAVTICKPEGRYLGWPTVCRRAESGELLVVFSGDREGHICPYGKVQMIRSKDDGHTWSQPETLFQGKIDYRDAGIVELKDGTLVCNWFTSVAFAFCHDWRGPSVLEGYRKVYDALSDEEVNDEIGFWSARSTDGGKTWTDRVRMPGQLPHNVIELKDGRLFCVCKRYRIANKNKGHTSSVDASGGPMIAAESVDGGRSWREIATIIPSDQTASIDEPHSVQLPDGRIICHIRHEAKPILQTESEDGGKTWTKPHDLPLYGFPAHLLVTHDGRLFSVYSKRDYGNPDRANGEYACESTDGGRTWDPKNEILLARTCSGDHGYPASVELPHGEILTVFYAQDKQGTSEPTCLKAVKWRPLGAKPMAAATVITVKPGESLVAARDAARRAKKPVAVELEGGIYPIDETLMFGPEDSGVVWRAAKGADAVPPPIVSGALEIEGWENDGDGVWSAPLPKYTDGKPIYFDQLWINGRRATRSVWPKDRWLQVAYPWLETVTNGSEIVYVQHADLLAEDVKSGDPIAAVTKEDMKFLQMRVVHAWTFARCNITDYILPNRQLVSIAGDKWQSWKYWNTYQTLVSFENLRSAFTGEGDWFYDAPAGRVRYRPFKGEEIETARVAREGLTRLVDVVGRKGAPVRDLRFENIVFEGSAVTPLRPGLRGPNESVQWQAACFSDSAVRVGYAERVVFSGCGIVHTGNYALDFTDGAFDCAVESCRLEDLGAGGVRIGSKDQHVAESEGGKIARRMFFDRHPESVAGISLTDTVIDRFGEVNPEGTGVAVMHASDCKVLHCDIGDGYYTGVSVGWVWGYAGSVAQRNEIGFNRIHDLGKNLMSDMSGIYTLGTSHGTYVHDNVVRDVDSYDYGGCGLYTDEGSEGIVFERNLCYNAQALCNQHYGVGCIYRNNVFAFPEKNGSALCTARREADGVPSTVHIVNNVFLSDGAPLACGGSTGVLGLRMNNLWWDMSGKCDIDGFDWPEFAATGRERNSVYADPKFVDAKKGDFRLKKDSPAFALGFVPFDTSSAGPRDE